MKKAKVNNGNRNRILAIVAAAVIVLVALVLFMNANSDRIIEQDNEFLKTSTGQTSRRLNDLFSTSMNNVERHWYNKQEA